MDCRRNFQVHGPVGELQSILMMNDSNQYNSMYHSSIGWALVFIIIYILFVQSVVSSSMELAWMECGVAFLIYFIIPSYPLLPGTGTSCTLSS
jgi:hypothetical protein